MSHILSTINLNFLLVAFVHWYASFFWERGFYETSMLEKPGYAIAKLVFLACLWQIVAYMIRRYKEDIPYRRYIHYAGGYFIFSMAVLLLIWPGYWYWDELFILTKLSKLQLFPWQHFLTNYFYIAALFIYPTPVMVVIAQLVCMSAIVGYLIHALSTVLGGSKLAWLAYLPFLFPSVLIQNYIPMRATLFAYLILFFITRLLFMKWQGQRVTWSNLLLLGLLAGLMATLRGEGSHYVIAAPVLFVCAFWNLSSRWQKISFCILTCLCAVTITQHQNSLLGHNSRVKYQLTLVIAPLKALIVQAQKDGRSDLLVHIESVLDISQFEGETAAHALHRTPLIRKELYSTGIKKLMAAYLKLIAQYPKVFVSERIDTFKTTGQEPDVLFGIAERMQPRFPDYYELIFKNDPVSSYLDQALRSKTLNFLALNTSKSEVVPKN